MPGELSTLPELVVVSNRGPVTFERADDGAELVRRGAGGLVTGLSALPWGDDSCVWVCAAMTETDCEVAAEHQWQRFPVKGEDRTFDIRFVGTDPVAYDGYYNVVSNPILWFLQHSLWDLGRTPVFGATEHQAFDEGYVVVNQHFADAVIDELGQRGSDTVVMVHDYHLYLVGDLVRQRCPEVRMQHFVHVPWPQPEAWRVLPNAMREQILRGLLGNDIVAFHTERYARAFLATCEELLGLPVDHHAGTVTVEGRTVRACHYPISIDTDSFLALSQSPEIEQARQALREEHGSRKLVVRVDRADPSKNIVRGFAAFGLLLEQHPELHGEVVFLALIQPTRAGIAEYETYLGEIEQAANQVNHRFGRSDWQPVDLRIAEDLPLAIAAYEAYDVLVVNAVFDGLNLVAKEGVLVNRRDGVLVLSENAGVHEELGAWALTVNPFDLRDQADALCAGLDMDAASRRDRAQALRGVVRHNDLDRWLDAQLADIRALD